MTLYIQELYADRVENHSGSFPDTNLKESKNRGIGKKDVRGKIR